MGKMENTTRKQLTTFLHDSTDHLRSGEPENTTNHGIRWSREDHGPPYSTDLVVTGNTASSPLYLAENR
jgi:hypothetical protein